MAKRRQNFKVYTPLHQFVFDGESTEIARGLMLQRFDPNNLLQRFETGLTPYEKTNLPHEVGWWLVFDSNDHADLSPAEIGNVFLLALWLVKTTKAKICFRFEVSESEMEASVNRLHDQFVCAKEPGQVRISVDELREASAFYSALALLRPESRLFAAQILTMVGCWQIRWQAAILNFASASETLLTYSSKFGLSERLATSYACLLYGETSDRDWWYTEFRNCYSVRSDVVHGRSLQVRHDERVVWVVRWQSVLRALWKRILLDRNLTEVLNRDDERRREHFAKLVGDYRPPVSESTHVRK